MNTQISLKNKPKINPTTAGFPRRPQLHVRFAFDSKVPRPNQRALTTLKVWLGEFIYRKWQCYQTAPETMEAFMANHSEWQKSPEIATVQIYEWAHRLIRKFGVQDMQNRINTEKIDLNLVL